MDQEPLITRLRAATEDDVTCALEGAYIDLGDRTPVELLEFFNRMIDMIIGEKQH